MKSRRYKATNRPIRIITRCINYPGDMEIQHFKSLGEAHNKKNLVQKMVFAILTDHIETMDFFMNEPAWIDLEMNTSQIITNNPKNVTDKKTLGFKVTLRRSSQSKNNYYVSKNTQKPKKVPNKEITEKPKKAPKKEITANPKKVPKNDKVAASKEDQPCQCLCGKKFGNRNCLRVHKSKNKACKKLYLEERKSNPDSVTCTYCGKKYANRKTIRAHVGKIGYCHNKHKELQLKTCREDQDIVDKKTFKCQQCKTRFLNIPSLNSHCNKFNH